MGMTVLQIQDEQKKLEKELVQLLNAFNEKTGIHVVQGTIGYGFTNRKNQNYVWLEYYNPFKR